MNHFPTDESKDERVSSALAEYQDKLYALIRMLMVSYSQDAADVLQQTNRCVLDHTDQYDPSRPIWLWFKGIASNQVLLYYRSKKRAKVSYDTDLVEQLVADTQEDKLFHGLDLEEYLDALRHCMGKVPPEKQDLIRERYMESGKVAEIAQKHSLSVASLSRLLYRLRMSLQECIKGFIRFRGCKAALGVSGADPELSDHLDSFLDGEGTETERSALEGELLASPEKRMAYMEQAFLHAFLQCRKGSVFDGSSVAAKPVFRVRARAAAIAAMLALALSGGIVWRQAAKKTEVPRLPQEKTAGGKAAGLPRPAKIAPPQLAAEAKRELPLRTPPVVAASPVLTEEQPAVRPQAMKGEEQMNQLTQAAAVTAVAIFAAAAPRVSLSSEAGAETAAAPFFMDSASNTFWRTLSTPGNAVFHWEWPKSAVSASITMTNRDGSDTTNITDTSVTECACAFPAPGQAADERVYTVTLTFANSSGARVGSVQTAEVAAVRGFGQTVTSPSRFFFSTADAHRWKSAVRSPVFPVFEDVTSLRVDDAEVAILHPGEFQWREIGPLKVAKHTLAMDGAQGSASAEIERYSDGTVIYLK